MEQQVPWRRNCMMPSGQDLPERVELGWARVSEQPVPCVRPNPHHAGQAGFEVAKFHRANQSREVRAKQSNHRVIFWAGIYRHDKEHRSASERCRYGLWKSHSVDLRESSLPPETLVGSVVSKVFGQIVED